jgi:hypothetical protein
MRAMAYRRMGITISATVPKDFKIEQPKQFTDMIERTKLKVVAHKIIGYSNGCNRDDLGYGSQRKEIMDQGLTPSQTTQKGADENSNEMN